MIEFMLIVEGDGRNCSEEEMMKKFGAYAEWQAKYSENYISGAPFKPVGRHIDENGNVADNGAFLNADTIVGGYVHLKAKDIAEATSIAQECPLINPMRIQIRPFDIPN